MRAWRRRRLYERHVKARLAIRNASLDGQQLLDEQERRRAAGEDLLFPMPLPWQGTGIRPGFRRDILGWVAFAVEFRQRKALHVSYQTLALLSGCAYSTARNCCTELRRGGWLCSDEQYDEDEAGDARPIGWSVANTWRPGPLLAELLERERERRAKRDSKARRVAALNGAATFVEALAGVQGACAEDHRERTSDSLCAESIFSVSLATSTLSERTLVASPRARGVGGGGVAGDAPVAGAAGAGEPAPGGDEDPAGAARLPAPPVAEPASPQSPEPATDGTEAGEGVVAATPGLPRVVRQAQQAAARAAERAARGVTPQATAAARRRAEKRAALAIVDDAATQAAALSPTLRVAALAALAASLFGHDEDVVERAVEHHDVAVEQLPPSERSAARMALLERMCLGSTGASS